MLGRLGAAVAFLAVATLLALSSITSQLPAADVHALAAVALIVAPLVVGGVALILGRGDSGEESANVATFVPPAERRK
jgi:hypothetical protein